MIHPIRITAPVARPVDLDEAREQCRVTHFLHDQLLLQHIDAATEMLDGWGGLLGRCMISQVWRQRFHGWSSCLTLPMPGVTEVVLRYLRPDLTEGTVDPAQYQLVVDGVCATVYMDSAFVQPALSGRMLPVWVDFTAGYGPTPDSVPAPLRAAIKIHVQALYDGMPEEEWRRSYDALIAPFRLRMV